MGNQSGQLFDLRFQFSQQGVVGLDLPVQFATVRDDAAPLQRLSCHALVDGGPFLQTALGMAAVVDTAVVTGQLQTAVRCRGPRLAPDEQLFFTVPLSGVAFRGRLSVLLPGHGVDEEDQRSASG